MTTLPGNRRMITPLPSRYYEQPALAKKVVAPKPKLLPTIYTKAPDPVEPVGLTVLTHALMKKILKWIWS